MTGGYKLADVREGFARVVRTDGSRAGMVVLDGIGRWCWILTNGQSFAPTKPATRRLAVSALIEADAKAQERELADFIKSTPPGALEAMAKIGDKP